MAVDTFLELDGVEGEAQDKKMSEKNAIDILAWSWGMTQSGTTHTGKGSGSGKVNVSDISISKYVDSSSATLMQFCCVGKHISKGTLTVRKAGGDKDAKPLDYIVIKFKELIVTSISTGGTGSDDRLTENITLNFEEFDYAYSTQSKKGEEDKKKEWKWNIAQNASG